MPSGFETTFRREYPGVVRLARRLTGDDAEAQDVAQDVMSRLVDHGVADRPDEEVRAWLWRVTTNTALNRIRGRGRERARLELVGRRHVAVEGHDDTADAVAARHDAAHVRGVLSRLSERQAAVLVLRHSGCSYAEIADVTGLAAASVGTVLARAERAFRTAYEETQHVRNAHVS